MMIQYTIIATILAACILYAAFRIYKSLQQANKCKDGNYRCSGCAFYEQCKKKGKLDNTNKKLDSRSLHRRTLRLRHLQYPRI